MPESHHDISPAATRIRVVIVDDEPLGLEKLRGLLQQDPRVDLVGEATNGDEAVQTIRELRPDLVFLDINLPGRAGFAVVEDLGDDLPRAIVFVTAHDEFALKAFEVNAVDYLLKPYDKPRFRAALDRSFERLSRPANLELTTQLNALLSQFPARPDANAGRIAIKSSGRILFVNIQDIDWVGSADNYVEIHTGVHTHLLRETLNSMERRLDGDPFVRISRTTIVNRHRIRELQPLFHGEYAILLQNGTRLTLSRSFREQLPRLGVSW